MTEYGASGPVIVWENLGCEGWHPKSYPDLKSAVSDQRYNSEWVVTKKIDFVVMEVNGPGRPRIEDRDKTLTAAKPWVAAGMSRRTWYRRRAWEKRWAEQRTKEKT